MAYPFEKELIDLAEYDLAVRERLSAEGKLARGYHPEMEAVHKSNAQRLREIISEIGFPTISKVGQKASDAAWLIIQHSIGEPKFMKECYRMMMENSHDINPKNRAYLHDRIHVFQGKPQKYGTQLIAGGIPFPVEDKENLNREREEVNLLPLSEKEINQIPDLEEIPEIDSRDQEYISWRKKVGWM
ncbi:DUF6624 domain-containing protein [Chryseobacterium jejuense]|uniref:Uncharacterized protein n=1 Tax=Chryseobacterium jejuense TaxID=445960 RepID=A0A2X2WMT4_CHRJE|nr:DUF6624 domain-containing protein [Chryseobacterium jejuense]SDI30451.1 hypothetical protein SAMN05421542_0776 [Chryseobacterium jejuense]SQB44702.1 Uncharacterised protein [Chryseobacterium jejuense]